MKNIVIVTPARSGSEWLTNHFVAQGRTRYGVADGEASDNHLTIPERIDKLKTMSPWITKVLTDEYIDLTLLEADDVDIIWLSRTNIAEHFISMTFATRTGVFNVFNDGTYTPPEVFNPSNAETDYFENIVHCRNKVFIDNEHRLNHIVTYENLFTDNPWNFKSVDNTVRLNQYKSEWIEQATTILNAKGLK